MGSSYEIERNKKVESNLKRMEALNIHALSRNIFESSSITKPSKINKEVGLKPKLKVNKEVEVPVVRSSHELAKVMQIKREKIMSNSEQSNAHVAGIKEHVSKQNKTPATNIVRSKAEGLDKQIKGVKQPLLKIVPQAHIKLSNFVTSGQKESQNHSPKKVANEALMTKSKGSMQNHNPQKQPMTKVVIEEVESPMKVTVGENDNSRSNCQGTLLQVSYLNDSTVIPLIKSDHPPL